MLIRSPRRIQSRKYLRRSGFSLVEVVIAIGLVGFALLAIVGSLPVGIQSMQDSMQQQARAAITQQLRADLQQIPFSSSQSGTAGYNIEELKSTTWFYTSEGMKTEKGSAEAFYSATFELVTATIESEGENHATEFDSSSARNVRATLEYPLNAPEANRKQMRVTLFSAKQKNA